MRTPFIRLKLRRSARVIWLIALLLPLQLAAASNICSSVFDSQTPHALQASNLPTGKSLTPLQYDLLVQKGINPTDVYYLGSGAEGSVFLNRNTQTVVKLFHQEFAFKNALWLEKRLTEDLATAGYKFASTLKADSDLLLIEHKLIGGMDLYRFTNEFLRNDPIRWESAFNQYRKIFKKLRSLLRKDKTFIDDSEFGERGYFDSISGVFNTPEGSRYINFHEQNIMVNEVAPYQFQFILIDLY